MSLPPVATVDQAAIQQFFALLYPDVAAGYLVLSSPGKRGLRSVWVNLATMSLAEAAQVAGTRSAKADLYFGVALQHPTSTPQPYRRSTNAGAYLVPGLWFDLDLAYGQHAASILPQTDAEALDFLTTLQAPPSLLVHSGGGLYGYWLFKEPYVITTEAERETIATLSKQWHYTLGEAGKQRGWTLDAVGDLARVLRPPGTINTKYGTRVEVLNAGAARYNPIDFDWLLALPEPATTMHAGAAVPGQPDLVAIAAHYGTALTRKSTTELAGAHPQHGSSTGDNFNIHVAKGLWHCWRHSTGGDALALIAVCEGLVPCEAMQAGALRGDTFRRVVDMANRTFQAGIMMEAEQRRNGDTPGPEPTASPQEPPGYPVIIAMDQVEKRPIEWLWWPYIAVGKVCMLDGDPGVGKTLLAIQLAANLSQGWPLPDQHGKATMPIRTPAPTVFIATEDDLADTMKARLDQAEADCTRIKIFNEFVDAEGHTRPFTLQDMPFLEQCLATVQPRLVVIDAIQAVLGGKIDINRANQVTDLLRQLSTVAARYHCAIVCIRHPSKPGQNIAKLIHRGMGSQAFIGSARLGLFVEDHPGDTSKVIVVQSKSNAGERARTQIFSKRGGQFEWCGVTRVNKEMMAGGGKGPTPQAFLEACFWLEDRLKDGRSYAAKDLQEEMKEEGLTLGVAFTAKKALGIVHTKTPAGTFAWHLPPLPLSTPSTSSTSSTSLTSLTSVSSMNTTLYEEPGPRAHRTELSEEPEQLTQLTDVTDVSDVSDVTGVVPRPPPFCPGCARSTTWLDRQTYVACAFCHWQWIRPLTTRSPGDALHD